MRHARRFAGWLLLLVPFVPLRALFEDLPGTAALVPPSEWLLGLFIFGVAAMLLGRLVPAGRPAAGLEWLQGRSRSAAALAVGCLVALAVLLVAVSTLAYARRPLLIDSVVQVFQARIFASGAVWAPAPTDPAFFAVQHMVVDGGRWYSQYPPGHAGLLALGVWMGAIWLVPVALSLGTAACLYGFARRAYDRGTARLTLLILTLSPFFWFMGASHMNHVSTLFFVSATLFLVSEWERNGRVSHLFLAGLTIGGAFLNRPLTAVAVGIVLSIPVVRRASSRKEWTALAAGALGAAAAVGVYLWWNAATTGYPFVPGYVRLWGDSHGLGFHATPWGGTHTPLAGLRNELTDLSLLAGFAFEWPVPALVPVGVLFAAGWAAHRWDGRLLACFLAMPVAYFFYWHRDAFLGPRYLYSGLAFFAPLTARALVEAVRRLGRRPVWARSKLTAVPVISVATVVIALCFAYAAAYAVPRRWNVYRTGLRSMKVDLPALSAEAGIDRALVFVPVSWGNRLLARMRGAGISASQAERTYRRVDHCALELALTRAEDESWTSVRLAAVLDGLPLVESRLGATSPNADPTLRLLPGPLDVACLDELAWDSGGYGNFSPFLADQDPFLRGPLVIARDLRRRNARLRAAYPDRPAWLFRPSGFQPLDED